MIVTSQNSISIQKKFHVINFISKMQKVSRSSSQSLEWGLLQSFCQRGVSNLFFLFWEFAIFRIAETRSFFIHLIHILFSQNSKYEKKSFIVNDRSAKNMVRPTRTGSANLTEGSAEQFGRTSSKNNPLFCQIW